MKSLLHILAEIQERPWAITQAGMSTILEIVERSTTDIEAVAARIGKPLENTGGRVEMHGSVAVLAVEGPLFRYANLFTEISGATSIENLARDFKAVVDNPMVGHVVLNVNSPGGQVDGIQEFADQVRAGAAKKPVTAYVDGLAASGGYWLASAASQIIATESAFLGSIGVVVSVTDNRDAQERQGVRRYEIVSTQSPLKRADVRTDEGRAQLAAIADSLASLFIARVAGFRGTTDADVMANYGRGAILPASKAVAAGMADSIGSFEPLLSRLVETSARPMLFPSAAARAANKPQEAPMADTTRNDPPAAPPAPPAAQPNPAATAPPAPPAAAAANSAPPPTLTDRQRIAAILNCEEAQGRENLARTLALETDHDVETTRRILKAAPASAAAPPKATSFEAEMNRTKNPTVGVAGDAASDTPAAEADRVLRFVPKQRRVQAS